MFKRIYTKQGIFRQRSGLGSTKQPKIAMKTLRNVNESSRMNISSINITLVCTLYLHAPGIYIFTVRVEKNAFIPKPYHYQYDMIWHRKKHLTMTISGKQSRNLHLSFTNFSTEEGLTK